MRQGIIISFILIFFSRETFAQISLCDCWQRRDTSFSVVQFDNDYGGAVLPPDYRNDDGYTSLMNLPFDFCFYGTDISSIYINNNGNISFVSPYETFTATPFPDSSFSMIAPFWGDVDTRNLNSGIVYYKMTPTHLIVQWDSVGYYDTHSDKRNRFQLIITNGSDSLIPGGNVSFCYGDMQWTTGDASLGVNGFGGEPATVGVNKGNGINYIQFGRFDQPGNLYAGPYGNNGIDWLDNRSLIFSTCGTDNFNPIVTEASFCPDDTIYICPYDTLSLSVIFHSPEPNQVTTISAATSGIDGFSIADTTNGNTAYITALFTGTGNNTGFNTITFSGLDNGFPPGSTSLNLIIHVDSSAVFINYAGPFCEGDSAVDLYSNVPGGTWSGMGITDSTEGIFSPGIAGTGIHTVTYTLSGYTCSGELGIVVNPLPDNSLTTDGQTTFCGGDSVIFSSDTNGTHLWSNGDTTFSIVVFSTGNYFVNITDSNGCSVNSDTTLVTVYSSPPVPTISINGNILTSGSIYGNQWYYNGMEIQGATGQEYTASLEGIYAVIVTDSNGCFAKSSPFNYVPGSLWEITNGLETGIYPNPNNGIFTVMQSGAIDNLTFSVYNLIGMKIFEKKISVRITEIDLTRHAGGIYFFQINSGNRSSTGKIIFNK